MLWRRLSGLVKYGVPIGFWHRLERFLQRHEFLRVGLRRKRPSEQRTRLRSPTSRDAASGGQRPRRTLPDMISESRSLESPSPSAASASGLLLNDNMGERNLLDIPPLRVRSHLRVGPNGNRRRRCICPSVWRRRAERLPGRVRRVYAAREAGCACRPGRACRGCRARMPRARRGLAPTRATRD